MTVRKNQSQLSATEKRRFVNALLELKRSNRYDTFVTTHNAFIMSDTDSGRRVGHRSPSFLPWHRRFLIEFEQALQSVDPSVALPYWDWTKDRTAASSIWAADFLGGTGRSRDEQVMDGRFAFSSGNWPVTVNTDTRGFLRRNLGGAGRLPTQADVDAALDITTYDTSPWNSASAGSFRNTLEGWRGRSGLHNSVHVWVGGQMTSGVSPNDPVFWLHHAFIDKLWAQWQARHPRSGYLPAVRTPDVVDLRGTMRPWNDVTPADMLDHTRYYTFDTTA
ncbi:tyrosinase family protein [Streptomyces sp. NBC_01210]|uniref:tyrosinase MelC2 n=1 Tax=Streptomyces sp. NBC_01210 TaxID=2903774 RepID=UPI002E106BD8|nr:tyrosinase family protein [Streptomyces sp. NBC_01210]